MPNTTVPAAGEAMPAANLNRRLAILGGLTAAAALAATPKADAVQLAKLATCSPVMTLFREWEATWNRAGAEADTLPQSEVDRLMDVCNDLEARMLALPAISAADMAAKYIAHSGEGGFFIENDSPFMAEARHLVGEA